MCRSLLLLLALFLFPLTGAEKRTIDLTSFERRVYSQNGEDGIIQAIFKEIGTTPHPYYVEFGTENANECNTHLLRTKGWTGLLMDGRYHNPGIGLYKEFITAENINLLFRKYKVPYEFDLLSIDIDFNDFYVWHAIDKVYKPRLVIIEYNASHPPHEDKVVLYDPHGVWDGTNYFGASILALFNLGRSKGYSLVYADSNGINLFFIRDDLIQKLEGEGIKFKGINEPALLYKKPRYGATRRGHPEDPHRRKYVPSTLLLHICKACANESAI